MHSDVRSTNGVRKKIILGGLTESKEKTLEASTKEKTESLSTPESIVLKPRSDEELDVEDADDGIKYENCAICMEEYQDGDEIGWSHNEHCTHFFHRKCIHEWLMTHDECPCCRNLYLAFADDEEENDGGDADDVERGQQSHSAISTTANAEQIRAGDLRREFEQTLALARGIELFYQLSRGTLEARNSSSSHSAETELTQVGPQSTSNDAGSSQRYFPSGV